MGQCRGCTHVPMRLLTSQREALLAGLQEQSTRETMRLAHDTGALEIEARPYGCGSRKMAEVGTGFPLGLFYGVMNGTQENKTH